MNFKQVLQFEKENMPEFQWKYEKFLFVFLVIWLGGAVIALVCSMLVGFLIDGGIVSYIPIMVWGVVLAVTLAIFVKKTVSVNKKLRVYHTEKLEEEFFLTVDAGEGRFTGKKLAFNPYFWGGKLFLAIVVIENGGDGEGYQIEEMDNALYNELIRCGGVDGNPKLFRLFCEDKGAFVKALLRYRNAFEAEKRL